VLKMMPNKTERLDARGLAQIVRTGWFKAVRIKGHNSYVVRALLTAHTTSIHPTPNARAAFPATTAKRTMGLGVDHRGTGA
jgi:hypothetical protein